MLQFYTGIYTKVDWQLEYLRQLGGEGRVMCG